MKGKQLNRNCKKLNPVNSTTTKIEMKKA